MTELPYRKILKTIRPGDRIVINHAGQKVTGLARARQGHGWTIEPEHAASRFDHPVMTLENLVEARCGRAVLRPL